MEKAGFIGFGITAESASDIVLSNLKKTYTTQHIQHAAECIRRSSLPCVWIFMLGGPGETPDTIQETLDFVQNNIRPNDIAFFNIGLRIYPGTELERIARREGILKVPAADMLNPVFYLSPQLDKAWLMQKMQTVMKTHMNFLDSESLANPLVPLIHRIIYRLGMKLPVWTHTPFLRKTLRSIGLNV
jgi:radical SAM superfamily enzyme YgiQ (UPF0313 family)